MQKGFKNFNALEQLQSLVIFNVIALKFLTVLNYRDRDVRSLDIFDERAHPLTVRKVAKLEDF